MGACVMQDESDALALCVGGRSAPLVGLLVLGHHVDHEGAWGQCEGVAARHEEDTLAVCEELR